MGAQHYDDKHFSIAFGEVLFSHILPKSFCIPSIWWILLLLCTINRNVYVYISFILTLLPLPNALELCEKPISFKCACSSKFCEEKYSQQALHLACIDSSSILLFCTHSWHQCNLGSSCRSMLTGGRLVWWTTSIIFWLAWSFRSYNRVS